MNNTVIVQQPPTSGKVILNTTFGELDIELWCKECPKATKNFIQLCMEGYYDGTIFHRLIPNFMIQGGDPTGTGQGGESVYGAPFPDEYHQRLKFQARGMVAMSTTKQNQNGSQFFITLDSCQWLDKKHTIIGKIVGNTIYNLMQINGIDTDGEDRPIVPPKLIEAKVQYSRIFEVIINPFEDVIVRNQRVDNQLTLNIQKDCPIKVNKAKQRNVSLLSFQEEEEEQFLPLTIQSKSVLNSHDVLSDPKLQKQPAFTSDEIELKRQKKKNEEQKKQDLKSKILKVEQSSIDDMASALRKKQKLNQQREKVNLQEMIDQEDKNLLKFVTQKNENGATEIVWKESESSSSSSSSSELENEELKQQRQLQKNQYNQLKAEVLQFKKNDLGTYNELRVFLFVYFQQDKMIHEKKLLSNVEKRRLKYITDKKSQKHESEIMQKLNRFRNTLNSSDVQANSTSWMNHKLKVNSSYKKFHVDSVTAFSLNDNKEKAQDYFAPTLKALGIYLQRNQLNFNPQKPKIIQKNQSNLVNDYCDYIKITLQ